jgi:flagellar FliL protein
MSEKKPATPADAEPAKPRKSLKKVIFLVVGALLLAGGAAGATWFVALRHKGAETPHAVEKKVPRKPVFATLDPFTVNLADAKGERYAQIGITLALDGPAADELLKERLPAVRNEVLLLIASKHIEDLLTDDGKRLLAQQIRMRTAQAMGFTGPDDSAPVVVAGAAAPAAASASGAMPAAAAGEDKHEAKPAAAKEGAKEAAREAGKDGAKQLPDNPVQGVLFSQFIVQ